MISLNRQGTSPEESGEASGVSSWQWIGIHNLIRRVLTCDPHFFCVANTPLLGTPRTQQNHAILQFLYFNQG